LCRILWNKALPTDFTLGEGKLRFQTGEDGARLAFSGKTVQEKGNSDVKPGQMGLAKRTHLGEGHSEIKPPSPRSEVGSGPIPQTVKSLSITETKDTMINIPDDCGYQVSK